MNFELQLTEKKVKPHQVTTLHLLAGFSLMGAGALLYLFKKDIAAAGLATCIAGLAIFIIAVFRNKWLLRKTTNRIFRVIELVLLLSLTAYTGLHKWTPPAIMFGILSATVLFALFWENEKGTGLSILVDEAGIKLPVTSRKRNIDWHEVESALLRFGTLTINTADNRLYQWPVAEANFDTDAFNSFCKEQAAKGAADRKKYDW